MSIVKYNRPCDRDAFEIAIICALTIEADAVIAIFDDFWEHEEQYTMADGDTNSYTIGRIAQHNVVLVHMPGIGKVSAANVATNLRSSFPRIRLGLLVGICGGVPFINSVQQEIALGDVIISTQVVQTDFGRQYPDQFIPKDTLQDNLGRANPEIRGFLSKLQGKSAQTDLENQIKTDLASIINAEGYKDSGYLGVYEDEIYDTNSCHKHQVASACTIYAQCAKPEDGVCAKALEPRCYRLGCPSSKLVPRARIEKVGHQDTKTLLHPVVHFGAMASADQVMKSARHRDSIAEQERIVAFEMEGAGLWETIPTIVIKGVCDYADNHKNKEWQNYAAATAAACAKAVLQKWRPTKNANQDGNQAANKTFTPVNQVFSGTFTAGKNIHQGGTYNSAGPMYF